jgi:folate-binding protein YgfZ
MPGPLPNPLLDLHRQAQAELQPYADIEIVSTFGEPQAEYAAIHQRCGMMDLPQRGILELTGKDRLPFLNNLLTNQTFDKATKTSLPSGRGLYAFLLNAKSGRIITDVNVLELGERTLLELDARLVETLRQALDRYRFSEQVTITPRTGELHEIALHGPGTGELIAQAFDASPTLGEPIACGPARVIGHDAIVWRDDPCGVPGYHVIVPTTAARAIWMHLLTRFGGAIDNQQQPGKRPLRPIGWAAFNASRIEAGRPLFGIDFDDTVLALETGPLAGRAVSFTKGCYPGQEIVARMHARHQIARQIVGIRMEGDALPLAGTNIIDDAGNPIGGITSSTLSPVLSNAAICLGIVKRPHFTLGTKLKIPAEGAIRTGTVVELPFIGKEAKQA